jgi:hypothetical protein
MATTQIWRLPERARRIIWRAAGYEPSAEQLAAHLDPHRLRQVAGGERGGKSYWTAMEMLAWLCATDGPVWIIGPTYELARPEFLHLVPAAQQCDLLEPGSLSMPRSGPCSFRTRLGAQVVTKSGQDPETLAGIAPAGVAMVEAAQQGYEVFLRLRGRVAETRGPLVMSGTFETSLGWYPEVWQRWQGDNTDGGKSFSLPTWSNLAVFPGGRDDPEIRALEATYPPDVFMERFGAVPCPPATLVFKEFSHIQHVKACYGPQLWDHADSVQCWIDPGWAGAYAVEAVALQHGQVFNFDEIYAQGRTAQDIIGEITQREWWPKVSRLVIDVAGGQHQGMESHIEIWQRLTGKPVVAQPVPIPDGIQRHRTFLRDPASGESRLYHDPRCKGIIREYGQYKYAEYKEGRPERELPIDADNHGLKAIAYGLVANFGFVAPPRLQRVSLRVSR